jgi:putative hemolysin
MQIEQAPTSAALQSTVQSSAPRFSAGYAETSADIEATQRLRYRVFVEEMGATCPRTHLNRERDFFDPWCDHLLLRERRSGRIVGTCRLLTGEAAKRLGTFCCERQFDLTRLRHLRPRLVEVGRTCIELEYRTSAALAIIWSGVVRFVRERSATHIIGRASISMADGGVNAAAVHDHLASRRLAPIEYRAFARTRLAAILPETHSAPAITPLIRSYLHQGAWIGGEPAWDPDFNTADLLFLLPLARVATGQARDNHSERKAA